MSKKSELKLLIEVYKNAGNDMSKKINEIRKSDKYTTAYKNELIENERKKLEQVADMVKPQASKILSDSISSISKGNRGNTQDSNYQLSLSNALKLLELGAKNMNDNDLKILLEPFSNDFIAISAFRGALINAGRTSLDLIGILPVDNRGNSIRFLEGIKKNIEDHLKPSLEWDGLTGASIGVWGIEESLKMLEEDLSYKYEQPEYMNNY